ncbi:isochorismatase family protein [Paraferrimonas sp. SM1919]|uniref:isochorismatase family protein n=1 Tax=Paraferrimonas sp. SM1919 TaxID=2662263 RepID=UPI0013D3CAEB|nr:isochorismatase family protein [Paraferrimonas sp. SM1919]
MDLQRNYVELGDKPALLLVDMIKGFTSSECPLGTDCPEVVAANKVLLDVFRAKGLPVIYTTVVYDDASQAKVFRARINALNLLQRGSHWCEVDERLAMRDGEILIEKQWASSFHKTHLDATLQELGVNGLVVTGLTTSGCVRASVVDALQYDYPTVVALEAVGDRNNEAHQANLFDMHAKYADVMSVKDIIKVL